MLFIKKQYLVSQAHYSLTVKSSPVSIDKIKLLLLLLLLPGLQRRLKNSNLSIRILHVIIPEVRISNGKNDLVTRFQSVQSGKTKILPPHQTGLVAINLHLLSRPVW